ncbi:MAG: MBL fold metallo-hydrolase [Chloroflexi bacterium]|nr:MBL fold metallo-hydrolase [Chloroflexota bacterium]
MKIHFLGTGAAEGIPALGCDCAHCTRARNEGGKLVRERDAIRFSLPDYELLVDCAPDIRGLINKYQITELDGILATRSRYDHIGGIKEFEWWPGRLDFLVEDTLFETIKREHWTEALDAVMFHIPYYPGSSLYFSRFSIIPFAARRQRPIFGISVKEGETRVVYTSDTPVRLTNYARRVMWNCDLLIINAPTFDTILENHINTLEAIELKERVGARQMILTYINHENRPHDELESFLHQFESVSAAYDGMVVEVPS